jgi:hypothetical protein
MGHILGKALAITGALEPRGQLVGRDYLTLARVRVGNDPLWATLSNDGDRRLVTSLGHTSEQTGVLEFATLGQLTFTLSAPLPGVLLLVQDPEVFESIGTTRSLGDDVINRCATRSPVALDRWLPAFRAEQSTRSFAVNEDPAVCLPFLATRLAAAMNKRLLIVLLAVPYPDLEGLFEL